MTGRKRLRLTFSVIGPFCGIAALCVSQAHASAANPSPISDPIIFYGAMLLLLLAAACIWRVLRFKSETLTGRQQAENLHRVMVDRMQDGLYMVEGDHFAFVNPALARLVGYSVNDLIGRNFRVVIAPDSLSAVIDHHRRRRAGDAVPNSYEARLLHKDGDTEIPVIVNVELATLEDGRIVSIGTVKDITQRARIEDALRASERQLSEAQRVGRIGHWRIDSKTHEVECSDMYYEIYGWDKSFIRPTLDRKILSIHPDDRARINALRNNAVAKREPYRCVFRAVRPDGEIRVIRDEGQPEFDENGRFLSLFGVSQDITEQKKIEEELLRERIRAEEANSAKSEFLASISHEIRTPLNAILGFSEIMDNRVFGEIENERYAEYIGDIRASAAHLLDLVGDILDISAIEAGELALTKTNLDLGEILDECLRVVGGQARDAEVDLVAAPAAGKSILHADRRAVKQVLINLLTNAIKFTPKGGRVQVDVVQEPDRFVVSVSDTGVGIPKDVLPVVTLPFERGRQNPHESKEGTGLGLAIVNSLVALHGGNIEIESDVGSGTTVRVWFPMQTRAAA